MAERARKFRAATKRFGFGETQFLIALRFSFEVSLAIVQRR
jgi:hypothetical protein